MTDKIITKDNITLRPVTNEDTENIVRWRNEEHVRRNFLYQELFTPGTHLKWLKDKVETGKVIQFIISVDKKTDIGSVYLRDIDYEKKEAEYGIFIGEREALNRGYGSLCCKMLCDFAKNELKLKRLFLRLMEDNAAAEKSYENAGFKLIPDREEIVFSRIENKEKKVIFMEKML